jgi:tetratricopeptide (TPR) repeat protein
VEALPFLFFWQDVRPDLLKISIDVPETPERRHYVAQRDRLLAKSRSGRLTPEELVNLSAYQIRLRQYEEAIQLLQPVARQERQNFMLPANLATAYQLSGHLDQAIGHLMQVKDLKPRTWPGLTPEQLNWNYEVEGYHLKLLRLRYRENQGQPGGRPRPPETVDDLFGVRFVGESGQYEAGKLAAEEAKKLPPEAIAVVQQLLIWLPDDTRLYWLLGELYNAKGDLLAADRIFEDCVWNRRLDAALLREHRQIVQAALPRPEPPPAPGAWKPESWQVWTVASGAGLVVLWLAYWQVRQLFRRRGSVASKG